MSIQTFNNNELLSSVRAKINNNFIELQAQVNLKQDIVSGGDGVNVINDVISLELAPQSYLQFNSGGAVSVASSNDPDLVNASNIKLVTEYAVKTYVDSSTSATTTLLKDYTDTKVAASEQISKNYTDTSVQGSKDYTDQAIANIQVPDAKKQVFVSNTQPLAAPDEEFLWVETGLGDDSSGFTMWFNDPSTS